MLKKGDYNVDCFGCGSDSCVSCRSHECLADEDVRTQREGPDSGAKADEGKTIVFAVTCSFCGGEFGYQCTQDRYECLTPRAPNEALFLYEPCVKCGKIGNHRAVRRPTAGVKADSGKTELALISPLAIEELGKVLTFGAKKYAAHNWRQGLSWTRVVSALLRHTFAFLRGQDNDPETGLSHMAHVMCNAMFLVEYVLTRKGKDDRFISNETQKRIE